MPPSMPRPDETSPSRRVDTTQRSASSPGATQPSDVTPPGRSYRKLLPWLAGLGAVILVLFGAAIGSGYLSGSSEAETARATQVAQTSQEQFDLGVKDLLAGSYELARQRFDYILLLDPNYPGAAELLGKAEAALNVPTATPYPTGVPPTATPTLDVSSLQGLFDQAQAAFNQGDWSTTLEALITLRGTDLTYQAAQVDSLMASALRNRGLDQIHRGLLEQGIYDLDLAERFGPLDATANAWRNSARFYLIANSYMGLDWAQAATYFGQICSGGTWDSCAKYARAAMEYGHLLAGDRGSMRGSRAVRGLHQDDEEHEPRADGNLRRQPMPDGHGRHADLDADPDCHTDRPGERYAGPRTDEHGDGDAAGTDRYTNPEPDPHRDSNADGNLHAYPVDPAADVPRFGVRIPAFADRSRGHLENPPFPVAHHDVRVLVVADDMLARAGLVSLLDKAAGIAVVGQCGPEADLGALLAAAPAEVIAWDMGWEASGPLDRLEETAESLPPVVVLIHDPEIAADAWGAGARGVLDRDVALPALNAAIRAAAEGLTVAGSGLRVGSPPASRSGAGLLVERLTAREHEVLQLVAQGLPNKAIAGRLGVTQATVKFHVNSLMRKLGAQSRTDAVVRASRLGLVLL